MRTLEIHRSVQDSPADRDFHIPKVAQVSGDRKLKDKALSLFETFGAREKSEQHKIAMRVIDKMELNPDDGRTLYFYYLWSNDPHKAFPRIKKLVGEIREDEIERVVNRVNEDDLIAEQYDKFHNKYIRATERFRRRYLTVLLRDGVPLDIAAEEAQIRLSSAVVIKDRLDKDASEMTPEEKFFSVHSKAVEVLEQKKAKLSNLEISEKLGISLRYVDKLTRALLYFDEIESRPSNAKKTELRKKLLYQILELRTKDKLGNKEIAQKLDIPIARVNEGAIFLIWMGLVKPLEKSEVLYKRSGRRLHEEQLAGFLASFLVDNRVSLIKLHRQFCEQQSLNIGYDTFLSMYHEIGKRQIVPPSKATYGKRTRKRMIEEIQRIRATEGNVRINVKELCSKLTVDLAAGEVIFNTIKDAGPSNTKKWREEGRLRLLEILKEMVFTGETINMLQLCKKIGISHRFGLQVYHEMEGKIDLPPLKLHKQRIIQTLIFEAKPM